MDKPEIKHFGFWFNLRHMKVGSLVGTEGILSLLASLTLSGLSLTFLDVKERAEIASDFLSVATGLLGVMFASFALVGSLMSDRYMKFLNRSKSGVNSFFAPFIVNIGLTVSLIICLVVYRPAASHVPSLVEGVAFWGMVFLFLFVAFNVVALARNVFAHGVTRAYILDADDEG